MTTVNFDAAREFVKQSSVCDEYKAFALQTLEALQTGRSKPKLTVADLTLGVERYNNGFVITAKTNRSTQWNLLVLRKDGTLSRCASIGDEMREILALDKDNRIVLRDIDDA